MINLENENINELSFPCDGSEPGFNEEASPQQLTFFEEVVEVNNYIVTFYFYTGKILSINKWFQFIDDKNQRKEILCVLLNNNQKEYIDVSQMVLPFKEGDILTFVTYQIQNKRQKDKLPIVKLLYIGHDDYFCPHQFYKEDEVMFYSKKETILSFLSGGSLLVSIISLCYMNLPIFCALLFIGVYTKILEKKSIKTQLNNLFSLVQEKIEKEKIKVLGFKFLY